MVAFVVAGAIVAGLTFNYDNLINLAIMAYQGIVQIAVPMFLGIFWKGGNKHGALWGLVAGFLVALVITGFYPDAIPWMNGLTSGILALVVNLAIYLGCAFLIPQSEGSHRHPADLRAGLLRRRLTPRRRRWALRRARYPRRPRHAPRRSPPGGRAPTP